MQFLSLRSLLIGLGCGFLLKYFSESINYFESLYETFPLSFLFCYFPSAIHHKECISHQFENTAKQHLNLHCLYACEPCVSESIATIFHFRSERN